MATEFPEEGYADIRDYVQDNWTHIELQDGGDEVTRFEIESDDRASWDGTDVEVTVTGSDSDIDLPVTIDGTALFKSDSASDEMSVDTFAEATLEEDDDELNVTHEVQIPQE